MKKRYLFGIAIVVISILTIVLLSFLQKRDIETKTDMKAGQISTEYMHYEGPIMTLELLDNKNQIQTKRLINLKTAKSEAEMELYIDDKYSFDKTNTTEESIKTVYPFAGSIMDLKEILPKIKTNGKIISSKLIVGDYLGDFDKDNQMNLLEVNTGEAYLDKSVDSSYFASALKEPSFIDKEVVVYSFQNSKYPVEKTAATLAVTFECPKNTQILTYGFNGVEILPDGRYRYSYFANNTSERKLIFWGEAPNSYKVQGFEDGGCDKIIEGVSADIVENKILFSKILEDIVENIYAENNMEVVDKDIGLKAIYNMLDYTVLGTQPKNRYSWLRLEDIVSEAFSVKRIFYMINMIEMTNDKPLELSFDFKKKASYDFYCVAEDEKKGLLGYDLLTQNSDNFKLTEQKAALQLEEGIELYYQDFGWEEDSTESILKNENAFYHLQIKE